MRELERVTPELPAEPPAASPRLDPLAIVGAGRLGTSLARAGSAAGIELRLAGRQDAAEACAGAAVALLCVPDTEITAAAETAAGANPTPALVGHTSGATGLNALSAAESAGASTFSLHPLQTFANAETDPRGAPCAVAGSTSEALGAAVALSERLGMKPFEVPESSRAAYHAAASIASNFLVALEESAAELLERAGVDEARELLVPLVLRTAANWAEDGPDALTGPIARGDTPTVERHRKAIERTAPHLLPLYEALATQTAALSSEAVA